MVKKTTEDFKIKGVVDRYYLKEEQEGKYFRLLRYVAIKDCEVLKGSIINGIEYISIPCSLYTSIYNLDLDYGDEVEINSKFEILKRTKGEIKGIFKNCQVKLIKKCSSYDISCELNNFDDEYFKYHTDLDEGYKNPYFHTYCFDLCNGILFSEEALFGYYKNGFFADELIKSYEFKRDLYKDKGIDLP